MNWSAMSRNSLFFLLGAALTLLGYLIGYSARPTVTEIPLEAAVSQTGTTPITPIPLITPISPTFTIAKVTQIIDGDTIVIDSGEHVRYIGMNTPEIETGECYATAASEINKNLVLGKTVKLEKDISEVDKYGRLLRYVYIGNEMVNDELVKDGSAKVMTVPPDIKFKDEFFSSQNYAKENSLGLWSACSQSP